MKRTGLRPANGQATGLTLQMLPKRKIIRLQDFNYGSVNAYFITICVRDFQCVFGEIRRGIMGFSDLGNLAAVNLQSIPDIYPTVVLDEWIVMPNHIHVILEITSAIQNKSDYHSIEHVINQYKGSVKRWANRNDFVDFEWQSRFYDHIIRNEKSYHNIRNYIASNTLCWDSDRYHL